MPSPALVKRVETLERATNSRKPRVLVTFACEHCGHGLMDDDRGSTCGTHPALPAADTTIKIVFGAE